MEKCENEEWKKSKNFQDGVECWEIKGPASPAAVAQFGEEAKCVEKTLTRVPIGVSPELMAFRFYESGPDPHDMLWIPHTFERGGKRQLESWWDIQKHGFDAIISNTDLKTLKKLINRIATKTDDWETKVADDDEPQVKMLPFNSSGCEMSKRFSSAGILPRHLCPTYELAKTSAMLERSSPAHLSPGEKMAAGAAAAADKAEAARRAGLAQEAWDREQNIFDAQQQRTAARIGGMKNKTRSGKRPSPSRRKNKDHSRRRSRRRVYRRQRRQSKSRRKPIHAGRVVEKPNFNVGDQVVLSETGRARVAAGPPFPAWSDYHRWGSIKSVPAAERLGHLNNAAHWLGTVVSVLPGVNTKLGWVVSVNWNLPPTEGLKRRTFIATYKDYTVDVPQHGYVADAALSMRAGFVSDIRALDVAAQPGGGWRKKRKYHASKSGKRRKSTRKNKRKKWKSYGKTRRRRR